MRARNSLFFHEKVRFVLWRARASMSTKSVWDCSESSILIVKHVLLTALVRHFWTRLVARTRKKIKNDALGAAQNRPHCQFCVNVGWCCATVCNRLWQNALAWLRARKHQWCCHSRCGIATGGCGTQQLRKRWSLTKAPRLRYAEVQLDVAKSIVLAAATRRIGLQKLQKV